ncbi:MAG: FecR domain-containing protein [Bacteroidota bacterium]
MKHIPEFIQSLVQKYLDGTATGKERKIVDEWYESFSASENEFASIEAEVLVSHRVKKRLDKFIQKNRRVVFFKKNIFLRAAAIFFLICLSGAIYYYVSHPGSKNMRQEAAVSDTMTHDIAAGGKKAILTLGDGTSITLDSTSTGSLGLQGNTKVIKLRGGQLQYKEGNNDIQPAKGIVYNRISTPRGGIFKVELADGTNVWLNSSSSIRFPTDFSDTIREVEITGEAYFEVAHDPEQPFRVKVKDTYINVLGTHFDVMAYDNEESINTTLLEGSLKVDNEKSSKLLVPGEKAIAGASGSIKVIREDDPEEAIAWKNGKFLFNSADMHSIMRQVERWYDADVSFEREADLHFTGQVSRGANVSELLRKLELTNEVHFRIEKKKITVLP